MSFLLSRMERVMKAQDHEVVQGEMRLAGQEVPPVDQIKQDIAHKKESEAKGFQ